MRKTVTLADPNGNETTTENARRLIKIINSKYQPETDLFSRELDPMKMFRICRLANARQILAHMILCKEQSMAKYTKVTKRQ